MATKTTNLGLIKPEGTDSPPDITTLNQNWDKLDQELPNKLSKDGGKLSGNIEIEKPDGAAAALLLRRALNGVTGVAEYTIGTYFGKYVPTVIFNDGNGKLLAAFYFTDSGIVFTKDTVNFYPVYDKLNKPTPEEINASRSLQASTTIEVGAGKTFETIAAAISSLPKNLGGYNATILVDAGTYTGTVSINGFYGGQLLIKAADESNPPVLNGRIYVGNSACIVSLEGFKIVDSSGDYCVATDYAARLYMLRMTLSGPAKGSGRGLRLSSVSSGLLDACIFENLNIGAATTYGSRVSMYSPTVRNCVTGFYANAATVHISGGTITGVDISHTTEQGGRIYTGSQTAVPNY